MVVVNILFKVLALECFQTSFSFKPYDLQNLDFMRQIYTDEHNMSIILDSFQRYNMVKWTPNNLLLLLTSYSVYLAWLARARRNHKTINLDQIVSKVVGLYTKVQDHKQEENCWIGMKSL